MQIKELEYNSYFGDFEIERIVSEPLQNYSLFQDELLDSQVEQLNIFTKLENSAF